MLLRLRRFASGVTITCTAILIGLSSAACDDPEPKVGVRLNGAGAIEILYQPCREDQTVSSVALMAPDDVPLWQIEFDAGSPLRSFVVGEEPVGATTNVAVSEPPGRTRLQVEVSDIGADYFSFSELRTDEVLVVRRGYMSEGEFWARDTCG